MVALIPVACQPHRHRRSRRTMMRRRVYYCSPSDSASPHFAATCIIICIHLRVAQSVNVHSSLPRYQHIFPTSQSIFFEYNSQRKSEGSEGSIGYIDVDGFWHLHRLAPVTFLTPNATPKKKERLTLLQLS